MTRRTPTKRDYVRILAVGAMLVGLVLIAWGIWS